MKKRDAFARQPALDDLYWVRLTLAELWTLERLVRREHERADYTVRPLLAKLEQKVHEVQP